MSLQIFPCIIGNWRNSSKIYWPTIFLISITYRFNKLTNSGTNVTEQKKLQKKNNGHLEETGTGNELKYPI